MKDTEMDFKYILEIKELLHLLGGFSYFRKSAILEMFNLFSKCSRIMKNIFNRLSRPCFASSQPSYLKPSLLSVPHLFLPSALPFLSSSSPRFVLPSALPHLSSSSPELLLSSALPPSSLPPSALPPLNFFFPQISSHSSSSP
jgi:hypothetical protein